MPTSIDALIDRQLRRWELERKGAQEPRSEPAPGGQHVITISRQHGSSGVEIAAEMAGRFGYTLLHRNVIDRMVESTGYSRRLLQVLDERGRSEVTSWFDSMLAMRYVDMDDYVCALLKTVYSIARLGGVVVVGRGANYIVGLEHGVHFRVVAPLEMRVRTVAERDGLDDKEARRRVETLDRSRSEFVRKVFGRSVDDPLGYDLVVNEAALRHEQIVELMVDVAEDKFRKLRASESAAA